MEARIGVVPKAARAFGISVLAVLGFQSAFLNLAYAGDHSTNLKAGQVWSFKDGLPGEVLRIGVIEQLHDETVVSVSLSNVVVPENMRARAGGKTQIQIGHLPFSEVAVLNSLEDLIEEVSPAPDTFEQGYQTWKKAVVENGAGYFTISVAEARNAVLTTMTGN